MYRNSRDNILQVDSALYERKVIIKYNEANCAISDGVKNASSDDCITIFPWKRKCIQTRKVQSGLRNNNENEESFYLRIV